MPYYLTPQREIVDVAEDGTETRRIVPALPAGVGFSGDTDRVNYLVWTDSDLSEFAGGLWRRLSDDEVKTVVLSSARMNLQDVEKWSRGRGPQLTATVIGGG